MVRKLQNYVSMCNYNSIYTNDLLQVRRMARQRWCDRAAKYSCITGMHPSHNGPRSGTWSAHLVGHRKRQAKRCSKEKYEYNSSCNIHSIKSISEFNKPKGSKKSHSKCKECVDINFFLFCCFLNK